MCSSDLTLKPQLEASAGPARALRNGQPGPCVPKQDSVSLQVREVVLFGCLDSESNILNMGGENEEKIKVVILQSAFCIWAMQSSFHQRLKPKSCHLKAKGFAD